MRTNFITIILLFFQVSFSQKTINLTVNDRSGARITEPLKVTFLCDGNNTYKDIPVYNGVLTTFTFENINPNIFYKCTCIIDGANYHSKDNFELRSNEASKNINLKTYLKSSNKKDISKKHEELLSKNKELKQRLDNLMRNGRESDRTEIENLKTIIKKQDDFIQLLKKELDSNDEIPKETYNELQEAYYKLQGNYNDVIKNFNTAIGVIEDLTFNADCSCINYTDNSMTFDIKLSTSGNEKNGIVLTQEGQPFNREIEFRLAIKKIISEHQIPIIILTENDEEELIINRKFEKASQRIIFRSKPNAFHEFWSKAGYRVDIKNKKGAIVKDLYLTHLKDCRSNIVTEGNVPDELIVGVIKTNEEMIKILVRDNGIEDGDKISLELNGKIVFESNELKNEDQNTTINLINGVNLLKVIPVNYGRENSDCTAGISVIEDGKKIFNKNIRQNQVIKIIKE